MQLFKEEGVGVVHQIKWRAFEKLVELSGLYCGCPGEPFPPIAFPTKKKKKMVSDWLRQ